MIYEKKSCFEGRAGIIFKATSKCGNNIAFFGKWFESEEELRKLNSNYDIEVKVVGDCDIAYVRLVTKAKHRGLLTSDNHIPIFRNGSADHLFDMAS